MLFHLFVLQFCNFFFTIIQFRLRTFKLVFCSIVCCVCSFLYCLIFFWMFLEMFLIIDLISWGNVLLQFNYLRCSINALVWELTRVSPRWFLLSSPNLPSTGSALPTVHRCSFHFVIENINLFVSMIRCECIGYYYFQLVFTVVLVSYAIRKDNSMMTSVSI